MLDKQTNKKNNLRRMKLKMNNNGTHYLFDKNKYL